MMSWANDIRAKDEAEHVQKHRFGDRRKVAPPADMSGSTACQQRTGVLKRKITAAEQEALTVYLNRFKRCLICQVRPIPVDGTID
ncbi:hypothetical protein AAFG07_31690 [Bradyrhizobium sp. B097]|uniref:hypothetical protein n=1 Tax=Bradyrhizobium sp. B097 TaxID=3140244 RepID=UPI0031840654